MAECLDGKRAAGDKYQKSLQGPRMSDSLSMANDFHYDPFCEVCYASRNWNIQHEGFCKDCVQFLCQDCLRVHRKLQGTRGHVIERGDDMPKSMADKPPKFDNCDDHQQSRRDQFCDKHRVLLCSKCVPLHHKDCPVKSMDEACQSVPSSEIDALYDEVSDFKTNLSSVVSQIDHNIAELGKQQVHSMKEAQDLKDKNITKVDKLFRDMTSEIKSKYKSHTSELGQGQNELKNVIADIEGVLDDIDKLKGSTVDTKVFLKIQEILKDVGQCKSNAENVGSMPMNVKTSFIPDKRMKEFLTMSFKLAPQSQVAISVPEISFPVSPAKSQPISQQCTATTPTGVSGQAATQTKPLSQITAKKFCSYNIKLDDDKSACWITSMAITNDGRRLLVDNFNSKIKMFSRDMKFLCSLALSTKPRDIAVTGNSKAIVSSHEKQLLTLDISHRMMSAKGTVNLPFEVGAIAPYKDKLAVISWSTSHFSVKLIDLNGRVYWSIDTDKQGELYFHPPSVSCHDDGVSATLFVSDSGTGKLTVLNADTGDVVNTSVNKFFERSRRYSTGVTTDTDGNFYACYHNTDEVVVLAKDLSSRRVLISARNGLGRHPQAVVYNAAEHQLLVSYHFNTDSNQKVDCFKLQ